MKKSVIKNKVLKVGDIAPDFTLTSHSEGELNLKWYRERSNVVLAFYPGDWTPACSSQIPGYEEHSAKFLRYNCQVLGVSVDSIPSHKAWAASLGGISFPLLSDYWPHGQISQAYGVLSERGFSNRTVFLIDINGVIRFIGRYDYDKVPDINELFQNIDKLEKEATTSHKTKSFPT